MAYRRIFLEGHQAQAAHEGNVRLLVIPARGALIMLPGDWIFVLEDVNEEGVFMAESSTYIVGGYGWHRCSTAQVRTKLEVTGVEVRKVNTLKEYEAQDMGVGSPFTRDCKSPRVQASWQGNWETDYALFYRVRKL